MTITAVWPARCKVESFSVRRSRSEVSEGSAVVAKKSPPRISRISMEKSIAASERGRQLLIDRYGQD